MSPVQQELNQYESPHAFLNEAYVSLGYTEGIQGSLLNATDRPLPGTEEEKAWLDKGDWLALAHKVGAEKVFFVRNDPVFVFCTLQHSTEDENSLLETFRRVWCMSRPRFLFVAMPGELRVYRLDRPPARNAETLRKEHQIELVTSVAEIAEQLKSYRREQVESGRLFADERFGGIDQRADKRLIQDLKRVREALLETGLLPEYAHALIGRSIFIRYLEDRGIIDERYFIDKVVKDNTNWLEMLLRPLPLSDVAPGSNMRRYNRILPDKLFTYALFRQLMIDFNGDMFPDIEEEEKKVTKDHLELLQGFLLGNTKKNQPPLFLWAYDFQIIPIELISSIYEEFYHKQNSYSHSGEKKQNGRNKKQDDKKTHYTPSVLVEYVLSNLLPGERLAINPKILDPACGSGIFLVESFRRIVRYWVQQQGGERLSSEALRKILKEQIRGIEINEEAVHVAAFSLYLALLHYQEPPAIRIRKLPHLIYKEGQSEDEEHFHVLFKNDTFALTYYEREQVKKTLEASPRYNGRVEHEKLHHYQSMLPLGLQSFDVITGNPPWGFEKGETKEIQEAQAQAKRWCEYFGWTIGDNEPSQTFIARVLSLMKSGGECGLLVPTGVFLKHHENSKEFRRRWLAETTIKTIVNFAHVRHVFFNEDANAPFAFVHFTAQPAPLDHWVHYWSVKKTEMVDKTQAVVLGQPDIRQVKQIDLEYDDFLWKVYWWGNHRDANLIKALRLNTSLYKLARMRRWPEPGHGFNAPNSDPQKNIPSKWLLNYKKLPTKNLERYGPTDLTKLEAVPDHVYRLGYDQIQEGWRLLIGQGITQVDGADGQIEARLEHETFCFNTSIFGVNLNDAEDWERKVLIGIVWSSLARYYYFMTASSWGTWHHQLHLEEAMGLPVLLPKDSALREEIVNIVTALMNLSTTWEHTFQQPQESIALLEQRLDSAIFKLYDLSESECDLILDLCEVNLEFLYRHSHSFAARSVEQYPGVPQGIIHDLPGKRELGKGLAGYLYAFLQFWNRELAPDGEFFWRVIRPTGVPMIAVVFTTQEVGDTLPAITSTDDEEWREILKRCSEALKQPISRRIYVDSMVRVVTDTEIYIIKRDERRLWTRSMAREDAEATLVRLMHLQEEAMKETV